MSFNIRPLITKAYLNNLREGKIKEKKPQKIHIKIHTKKHDNTQKKKDLDGEISDIIGSGVIVDGPRDNR